MLPISSPEHPWIKTSLITYLKGSRKLTKFTISMTSAIRNWLESCFLSSYSFLFNIHSIRAACFSEHRSNISLCCREQHVKSAPLMIHIYPQRANTTWIYNSRWLWLFEKWIGLLWSCVKCKIRVRLSEYESTKLQTQVIISSNVLTTAGDRHQFNDHVKMRME